MQGAEMKAANRFGFFLYFIWVSAAMWISRQKLSALFDPVSNQLFHKSLSQRSGTIQIILILTAALPVSFLIWFFIRKVKNTKWIRLVCILVSAVLIGIICWNQTLRRDDYWEIRDAFKYGFPGYIIFEYTHVCGRYFSQFLKSLYQFFPPTEYINTLLIITFLLLCTGCILLLRTVLKRFGRFGKKFKVERFVLHWIAAGWEPYTIARVFSIVNAGLSQLSPICTERFHCKDSSVWTDIDFVRDDMFLEFGLTMTIRIGQIIGTGLGIAFAALRIYLRSKRRTKAEAKEEQKALEAWLKQHPEDREKLEAEQDVA